MNKKETICFLAPTVGYLLLRMVAYIFEHNYTLLILFTLVHVLLILLIRLSLFLYIPFCIVSFFAKRRFLSASVMFACLFIFGFERLIPHPKLGGEVLLENSMAIIDAKQLEYVQDEWRKYLHNSQTCDAMEFREAISKRRDLVPSIGGVVGSFRAIKKENECMLLISWYLFGFSIGLFFADELPANPIWYNNFRKAPSAMEGVYFYMLPHRI